jgi:hypothetical protein
VTVSALVQPDHPAITNAFLRPLPQSTIENQQSTIPSPRHLLTLVQPVRGQAAGAVAGLAEGEVALGADDRATGINYHTGGAELVAEDEIQHFVYAHDSREG